MQALCVRLLHLSWQRNSPKHSSSSSGPITHLQNWFSGKRNTLVINYSSCYIITLFNSFRFRLDFVYRPIIWFAVQIKLLVSIWNPTLGWNVLRYSSDRWKVIKFRSSYQKCSVRKGVLRNFTKFTGKHQCQSLFFNKVTGLRPEISKNTFFHRTPLVAASVRKPFLENTSGRLFLKFSLS